MNPSGKRCAGAGGALGAGVVALGLGAMCLGAWAQTSAPVPAHLLLVNRDRDSGIYRIGETVGWSVTRAPGAPAQGYRYVIKENGLKIIGSGELHFAANVARIEVTGGVKNVLLVVPDAGDLRDLLRQRHPPQQVLDAPFQRHGRILIGRHIRTIGRARRSRP